MFILGEDFDLNTPKIKVGQHLKQIVMFIIKSNNRRENFLKSLLVAIMLTGSVLLDANLPANSVNNQYETVQAGLFGWERDEDITRAYVGGKVVYTERFKVFGITFKKREVEVQL